MKNFGKIKNVLLIGGGYLMYYFAKIAKKKGLNVISIIAPRHSKEIIFNNNNLESVLKKESKVFKLKIFGNKEISKILFNNKNTLFFSFDSPWVFNKIMISKFFKNNLINSHSTRLPQDRGGGGFSWRILNQNKFGTCALHLIQSNKVDSGDILSYEEFIFPYSLKKPIDYQFFQIEKEKKFLKNFLNKIIKQENFQLSNQPEYLSTYFPRLSTADNGWIDWSLHIQKLFNFICAFDDPYIGASTFYEKRQVKIKSVTMTFGDPVFHPYQFGMIYRKTNDWIVVGVNGGSLIIEEVLNDKNKNILNTLKVGSRFFTTTNKINNSKTRKYFTPLGKRKS